jgi:hypothetical protein
MSLAPPQLRRTHAVAQNECFEPSPDSAQLILTVKMAYSNLPFKGDPLVLPSGLVACNDMWQASLENMLDYLAEDGIEALRAFNLETWLVSKVEKDGTDTQRIQLRGLRDCLDAADLAHPADDDLRSFYSSDLLSDHFVEQPLQEVEVYRELNLDEDFAAKMDFENNKPVLNEDAEENDYRLPEDENDVYRLPEDDFRLP